MKNYLAFLLLFLLVGSCSPLIKVENIKTHGQKGQYWCWAAATQMVVELVYGVSPSQCEYVQQKVGNNTRCCDGNEENACFVRTACDNNSVRSTPGSYLNNAGVSYQINEKHKDAKPSWEELKRIIDSGSPLIYSYNVGTTHIVVITGYFDNDSSQQIQIFDPAEGGVCRGGYITKSFEDFSSSYLYYLYNFKASAQP